jgi:hypothetical protein
MKSPPSPEKKRAGEDGRPDRHREKKTNNQTLPDFLRVVNADRKVLRSELGVDLFELKEGKRVGYEVVCFEEQRWTFGTLFMAIGKFATIANKAAQP